MVKEDIKEVKKLLQAEGVKINIGNTHWGVGIENMEGCFHWYMLVYNNRGQIKYGAKSYKQKAEEIVSDFVSQIVAQAAPLATEATPQREEATCKADKGHKC